LECAEVAKVFAAKEFFSVAAIGVVGCWAGFETGVLAARAHDLPFAGLKDRQYRLMPDETKTRGRPRNERIAGMMAKHGCSRATAYRKAKGADRRTLRQQNTALKQEVARLRATAQAARPEGFAMKALKAAMAKTDAGIVGYHDANFEFHEAGSPPPYPLRPRVPAEARPAILEMWEDTLPDKEVREALERLATDDKMKMHRGVWKSCAT
jgi:hypothetical protein